MLRLFKSLTKKKKKINGRNNTGSIVVRHRGGGCKKRYRVVDFYFSFLNIPGIVLKIEKDPNRSCFIALILFKNGFFSYILASQKLKVGSFVKNIIKWPSIIEDFFLCLSMPLKILKAGSIIFNIELHHRKGSALCRSAGSFGIVLSQFNFSTKFVIVRLKSNEEYLLNLNCFASLGLSSNASFKSVNLKKAGVSRLLGRRPSVRGVAMNPVDHPHGGGEGKTSGGRSSVSPWGVITKGKRTRLKSSSRKFIYKSRFLYKKK